MEHWTEDNGSLDEDVLRQTLAACGLTTSEIVELLSITKAQNDITASPYSDQRNFSMNSSASRSVHGDCDVSEGASCTVERDRRHSSAASNISSVRANPISANLSVDRAPQLSVNLRVSQQQHSDLGASLEQLDRIHDLYRIGRSGQETSDTAHHRVTAAGRMRTDVVKHTHRSWCPVYSEPSRYFDVDHVKCWLAKHFKNGKAAPSPQVRPRAVILGEEIFALHGDPFTSEHGAAGFHLRGRAASSTSVQGPIMAQPALRESSGSLRVRSVSTLPRCQRADPVNRHAVYQRRWANDRVLGGVIGTERQGHLWQRRFELEDCRPRRI